MNREPDFDQALMGWLDQGVDQAPERFVWAALEDVERTAQRGAWQAPTEELFMQLKRAAPLLGIAAAVVLAIVAYQVFGNSNVGDAEPTPRAYTTEDLPNIIVTEATLPEGATIGETRSGRLVLVEPLRPGGDVIDSSAVLDGLSTDVDFQEEKAIYTTWSVLFETAADAEQAFDFIVTEHESEEGWDVAESRTDPGLGDESAAWTGELYDLLGETETIFWREGNLLLAAVGWAGPDSAQVRSIADDMAERAAD
jgi:hypothetical protein